MQRMTDQIVDQERMAAHPERFARKPSHFVRLQVMNEKAATDDVKAGIGEGKRQSIRRQRAMIPLQVGINTIQIGDVERDSVASKSHRSASRDFTETCGDFQERQTLETGDGNASFEEFAGGADSAEPPIDAAEVAQRGLRFAWRAILGIKNLL